MNFPGERGRFSGNRRGPCLDQSKSLVKSSLEEHVFVMFCWILSTTNAGLLYRNSNWFISSSGFVLMLRFLFYSIEKKKAVRIWISWKRLMTK